MIKEMGTKENGNEENLEACETVHLDHLAACSALKKKNMF